MALLPALENEGIWERHLIYGGPKVGKSWMYRAIALAYLDYGNLGVVHVIDNDRTTKRMLVRTPELKEVIIPHIVQPQDLSALPKITEAILDEVDTNDWLVVDMASRIWDSGPQWWQEQVYGETDSMAYWSEVRRAALAGDKSKSFGGYESDEWKAIKPAYLGWEQKITMNAECHVMMICEEGDVVEQYDKGGKDAAKYAVTGGKKPKGEKGMSHRVDTVMRASKTIGRGGKTVVSRDLTMIGDREREDVWEDKTDQTFTIEMPGDDELGFVNKYLIPIAGWVDRDE